MTRKVVRRRSIIGTAAIFAVIAIGSASATDVVLPLPSADRQRLDTLLGSGVVGEALPSRAITDVTVYFPLAERSHKFLVTSGSKAGQIETLSLKRARRPHQGQSAWRFDLSPAFALFLRQTAAGDLIMPSVSDLGEGVVVAATPANPFVIQGIKPGQSQSGATHLSVTALDDPSDQEYSGSTNGTYTYVGTYRLKVPAGAFDAILVRYQCSGKVGPAQTEDTAYYFFSPKVGLIAAITQEDVTAFWLMHFDSSAGKVLYQR